MQVCTGSSISILKCIIWLYHPFYLFKNFALSADRRPLLETINEIYIHILVSIYLIVPLAINIFVFQPVIFPLRVHMIEMWKIIQTGEGSFCCHGMFQVQEASILESLDLRNKLTIHSLPKHVCDSYQYLISGFILKRQVYGVGSKGTSHKVKFLSLKKIVPHL